MLAFCKGAWISFYTIGSSSQLGAIQDGWTNPDPKVDQICVAVQVVAIDFVGI